MARADVEALVVSWLNSVLTGNYANKAYGDKPATPGNEYVLVDRTGGPRENMMLDKAEILIEVYNKDSRATAKTVALDLADKVPLPTGLLANDSITRAKVNSMVNLDDTLGGYHRYQIYCDIWCSRTE